MEQSESFYGHGKLLLTSEYYILDGALSLALPTRVGQRLNVRYRSSYDPHLYWKSLDHNKNPWFEGKFEFWHFNCVDRAPNENARFVEKLLKQARVQNTHFLRDEVDVLVETILEFPLHWGLGSSSTLIYNLAQWAYVSPFELLFKTMGGSGYDVACAQATGPLLYQKLSTGPTFSPLHFDPPFKDQLYFVYLGKKQNTAEALDFYRGRGAKQDSRIQRLSEITKEISQTKELASFAHLLYTHEQIVAEGLGLTPIKSERFSDYWGEIKSLGAWGGDFVLVTSERGPQETNQYFQDKGLDVFIPYSELIMS